MVVVLVCLEGKCGGEKTVIIIGRNSQVRKEVAVREFSMSHDGLITENIFILTEPPRTIKKKKQKQVAEN